MSTSERKHNESNVTLANLRLEFAEDAKIASEDRFPSSGHWRYKLDSRHYARGFSYNEKLNSATLNGILNRISHQLIGLLHCNIKDIGLKYPKLARWCKLSDIQQGIYGDREGYVKVAWWNHYLSWLSKFFLRKDKLSDFFDGTEAKKRGYFTKNEASKVADLIYGINIPPMIVNKFTCYQRPTSPDMKAIEVRGSRVVMMTCGQFKKQKGVWYALFKICNNQNLTDVEVRKSYRGEMEIIPVITFESNMTYKGTTYKAGRKLVFPNGMRCIFKGNTILLLEGEIRGESKSTVAANTQNLKAAAAYEPV